MDDSTPVQVLGAGAVAAVALPGPVPYGLHSTWLPFEELPLASDAPTL